MDWLPHDLLYIAIRYDLMGTSADPISTPRLLNPFTIASSTFSSA